MIGTRILKKSNFWPRAKQNQQYSPVLEERGLHMQA